MLGADEAGYYKFGNTLACVHVQHRGVQAQNARKRRECASGESAQAQHRGAQAQREA